MKAAAVGAAVIVGGQALGPELRSRLIYASHGDRMAHLAEFARRLSPPSRPPKAGGPRNVNRPGSTRFGSSRILGCFGERDTR